MEDLKKDARSWKGDVLKRLLQQRALTANTGCEKLFSIHISLKAGAV